ncbi:hypothetical protein BJY00DRAFT_320324 [Aspergillus carlsbadensis]|nr:hypothetical protein BJY00DRAFT_320324 [Aspergillus carlsbadensis]
MDLGARGGHPVGGRTWSNGASGSAGDSPVGGGRGIDRRRVPGRVQRSQGWGPREADQLAAGMERATSGFFKRLRRQNTRKNVQLGPYLLCKFAVHGPPPYKKVPHQRKMAGYSASCNFTPPMMSVSMCREDPDHGPRPDECRPVTRMRYAAERCEGHGGKSGRGPWQGDPQASSPRPNRRPSSLPPRAAGIHWARRVVGGLVSAHPGQKSGW